jgi:hypothetical protein
LLSAVLFTVAAVIVLSLIPIYISVRNLNDAIGNGFGKKQSIHVDIFILKKCLLSHLIVPPTNLSLSFGTDISQAATKSLNGMTIVNSNSIARQVIFAVFFS